MGKTNYLAVDLGATSGRTVLATYDGQKIEMKELTRFKNPIIPLGGHMYWNLPALYYEVLTGLKKAADEGIEGISSRDNKSTIIENIEAAL